jgi:hypothetical protein
MSIVTHLLFCSVVSKKKVPIKRIATEIIKGTRLSAMNFVKLPARGWEFITVAIQMRRSRIKVMGQSSKRTSIVILASQIKCRKYSILLLSMLRLPVLSRNI